MIVQDLIDDAAIHAHDPDYGEIERTTWLAFVRSASRHARSSGWLIDLEDDETLEVAEDTWEYTVPQGFAYVSALYLEETINGTSVYVNEIPQAHWAPDRKIRVNGSVPVFSFGTRSSLSVGDNIKVVGQKRPTVYTDLNQDIDPGMEGFLLERTLYYAFRYLGAGMSDLSRWRQQMSIQAFQSSEMLLARHPQEFRVQPSSISVPGRG